jgi:hypothetical protein
LGGTERVRVEGVGGTERVKFVVFWERFAGAEFGVACAKCDSRGSSASGAFLLIKLVIDGKIVSTALRELWKPCKIVRIYMKKNENMKK